jgi:hypothetical protein
MRAGVVLASLVEGKELWQTVVASIVSGVGVTFFYALALYGVTRFADLSRGDRTLAAAAAATLAALAAAACLASVVFGIIVVTRK